MTNKPFHSLLSALVLLLTAIAIGARAETLAVETQLFAKPRVLVTIKPVKLMVEALAAGAVEVEQLGAANANPHAIALSLKERQQVADADMIIWLGDSFERQLAPLITQSQQPVLALGSLPALRFPKDAKLDLHIWMAPDNILAMLEAIAHALSTLIPIEAVNIQARLAGLKQTLTAQQADIATQLSPYRRKGFIVNHDAYGHWVNSFGLYQVAAVSQLPDQQLGARQRFALQQQAQNAVCMIVEPNDIGGQRLAKALGLPPVVIDPLGRDPKIQTLSSLLKHFTEGFSTCLGRDSN